MLAVMVASTVEVVVYGGGGGGWVGGELCARTACWRTRSCAGSSSSTSYGRSSAACRPRTLFQRLTCEREIERTNRPPNQQTNKPSTSGPDVPNTVGREHNSCHVTRPSFLYTISSLYLVGSS